MPAIILAIRQWIISLCKVGTQHKRELAFNTVARYSYEIMQGLPELVVDRDFFNLTDMEYEDIYLEALNYTTDKNRPFKARRLRAFHNFLAIQLELDVPDWSTIVGESQDEVDANIISMNEYERSVELILACESLNSLYRMQCAALIILGYKFGLRFGEALRLRAIDIQLDVNSNEVVVLVRSSVLGGTKSEAGIRCVQPNFQVTKNEIYILHTLVQRALERFQEDRQVALFFDSNDPRDTIHRVHAAKTIHTALRQVTGDETVRFHHLRHSYANGAFMARFRHSGSSFSTKLASGLFNGTRPNIQPTLPQRRLRSIATSIGHARPETTLASYLHVVEHILANEYPVEALKCICDKDLSYILQCSDSYPRVVRSRAGIQSKDAWKILDTIHWKSRQRKNSVEPFVVHPVKEILHISTSNHHKGMSAEDVDRLLVVVGQRQRVPDGIAERYGVPDATILSAVAEGSRLERHIQTPVYGLPRSDTWRPITWRAINLGPETQRIRKLIRSAWDFYCHLDNYEESVVRDGINAITEMFRAGRGRLLAVNSAQVSAFVNVFELLGLKGDEFTLRIPTDLKLVEVGDLNRYFTNDTGPVPLVSGVTQREQRRQRVQISTVRGKNRAYSNRALLRFVVCIGAAIACNKA